MRALIYHSCHLALRKNPRTIHLLYRGLSSSTCIDKTFSLPVGNNGSISLRVTRPKRSRATAKSEPESPESNVILYLPPGPLFRGPSASSVQTHVDSTLDEVSSDLLTLNGSRLGPPMQHLLSSSTSATVVTVNYRFGKVEEKALDAQTGAKSSEKIYKYPNPVHDTLVGFDWIQNHLKPTQLAVFGSHIGGSLALMLALTEAQSLQAVAAFDPVCDWTSLDDYCITEKIMDTEGTSSVKQKRSTRKIAPTDLVPLLEAREKFFTSPEKWFDSFASPILFLRSAGKEVPKSFPQYLIGPDYPVPVLKNPEDQTVAESIDVLNRYDTYSDFDVGDEIDPGRVVKRRKSISRWPPYGLDYGLSGQMWNEPSRGIGRLQVTLPWVRIFTQGQNTSLNSDSKQSRPSHHSREPNPSSTVLAQQGVEMISAMRRACFWGREKGYGERRANISHSDENPDQEIGFWIRSIFDKTIKDC
ncbi:hypothetical protein N7495_004288 [Penicillium taxi]|uniref:uncharacterized protein n=1 Tax=Penicillium taxi TaxID=168475 RepID=UPI00254539AC|nr:uncharacterized protein N7495_004288 [Penicillium taxi]KAJ5899544.1 hypothetical protein N7495_004288 [Penicillium taxi]